MDCIKKIGYRIRNARKTAGMSQSELAERLGKNLRTVQKYESGEIEPALSVLDEIAAALGVPWEDLLGCRPEGLSHVMLVEVEQELGPYRMDAVVLFNANRISQEEALKHVEAGEYNKNVLLLPKSQWISLFRDEKED